MSYPVFTVTYCQGERPAPGQFLMIMPVGQLNGSPPFSVKLVGGCDSGTVVGVTYSIDQDREFDIGLFCFMHDVAARRVADMVATVNAALPSS